MPFDSGIYEEILADYAAKRKMRKRERDLRLEELYKRLPELRELDMQMQNAGAKAMLEILEKPGASAEISKKMQETIRALEVRRRAAVDAISLPHNYTELVYDCKVCEDTGYVGGQLCACVRERASKKAKFSSDIAPMLATQNFQHFNLDMFSGEDREMMQENLMLATEFVKNFGKRTENLFFYGAPGGGKTFMSSCIANALIEKQVDVVYKSAARLFSDYLDYIFNRAESASAKRELDRVMEAELLIIDDLGTEAVNQHTVSYLFQLVNERGIRGQSTIISTNLTLEEVSDLYSKRVSSRIFEGYEMVEFASEDLRLKNRLED